MENPEEQLLAAIEEREETAYGTETDPTAVERSRAIDYYLGRPFGNEVEGRSQVVSKDVSDTIEWIKPSLMNIFAGGEQVCKFDPVGPEDEEAAAQETDYVNHVLQKKNNWFSLAYEWFTDSLLTRNAYAMAYWERSVESKLERYQGLTEDQLALIASDPSVQIVAHSPSMAPAPLHDVEIRTVGDYGCVKVCVLPPERCLVAESTNSVSVRDAEFFEYWDEKPISWLRENGFDVPDDIDDSGAMSETLVDQSRDIDRQTSAFNKDVFVDPAMRKVKVRMVWIKHDFNADGIAEYNYCVVVGRTILYREECENVPVACIVPTPFPHRHMGLSVYDAIADLQLIKSAMLRQIIDNTYLQNNGRYAISDKVNLDDMLTSRPGGVVRVKGGLPGNEIVPLQHPFIANNAINVVEYIDQIRQNRTGTSNYFTGVDQNALNKTASGIAQLSTAAAQRVELIARVFAEGVKDLFLIVHELTLKHATSVDKVQLRGRWVTVDPRQWKKRSDMTISVGLGAGNRQAQLANLQAIIQLQGGAMQFGLCTPGNMYNALAEFTKAAGFTSETKFWNDPTVNPPPPPQPDPKMMIEAERVKIERERLDLDKAKSVAEEERKRQEMVMKANHLANQQQIEREGMALDVQKTAASLDAQKELKDKEIASRPEKPQAVVKVNAEKEVLAPVIEQLKTVADANAQSAAMLDNAVRTMADAVQAMSRPKKIVRDQKTGRALGIE